MSTAVKATTLGLFILDTFEWRDETGTTVTHRSESVIGGGGTYAILGSRVWLDQKQVAILVDRGNDWPSEIEAELNVFGSEMWVYRNKQTPTTRALNLYTGEHRDFKYLTERVRLEPRDLPRELRSAEYLHFVCSPTRALVILSQLGDGPNAVRSSASSQWQPHLCYEPIPFRCVPEELDSLVKVLPHIKVFSPNHEEAAAFFGISAEQVKVDGKRGIEKLAHKFIELGAQHMVVIRSGGLGAFAIQRGQDAGKWVSAYHTDSANVKDVTGAGNSFLGGLMAGLVKDGQNLIRAVEMGAVSASYTIEQFGLAKMSVDEQGRELWNGSLPANRLDDMRKRRDSNENMTNIGNDVR
ncbi:hypothetical protein OIV83_000993 [Microbotryomycetes sp. JL201]|nr:hypothetical protein OIV83_000993 [Microbotryomycetes sp. JL201]